MGRSRPWSKLSHSSIKIQANERPQRDDRCGLFVKSVQWISPVAECQDRNRKRAEGIAVPHPV